MKQFFLLTAAVISILSTLNAQPGILDPEFNIPGYSLYQDSMHSLIMPKAAIQSDGKIIVEGALEYGGDYYSLLLIRYNVNGRLDHTFGNNGQVKIDSAYDYASLAVLSDDKILIGGTKVNSSSDFMLTRLDANGGLDNTFGTNGFATLNIYEADFMYDMAIQPDGKIVLVGTTHDTTYGGFFAAIGRFNANGTVDNGFANNGAEFFNLTYSDAFVSVAIQSDGKIVAAGQENYLDLFMRLNSSGDPDSSFNENGILSTGYVPPYDLIALPDGKIIAAGTNNTGAWLESIDANGNNATVSGYLPDRAKIFSSLHFVSDTEFIAAGIRSIPNHPSELCFTKFDTNLNCHCSAFDDSTLYAATRDRHFDVNSNNVSPAHIAVDAGGKIFLSAEITSVYPYPILTLKLNSDGSFDHSFGSGIPVTDTVGVGNDEGNACVIQDDGKIIIAGSAFNGTDDDFALRRYDSDGHIDTSFGYEGQVTTAVGAYYDDCYDVMLQPDGKIVAAGKSDNGTNDDFAVVRYNSDGTVDQNFGISGIATADFFGNIDNAQAVLLQPDGKIIAAGNSIGFNPYFAVARFNSNGTLDNSFGTGGEVFTFLSAYGAFAADAALQSDGKIVVAGSASNGDNDDIALVRYESDGSLDNTFGINGIVTTNIGVANDDAYTLLIQSDGKILVAGSSDSSSGTLHTIALLRYNSDGTLDNTFSNGGIYSVSLSSGSNVINSIALTNDDKIVVAGTVNEYSLYKFMIGRFSSNGNPDSTFGDNGFVFTLIGEDAYANDLKIQSDGKMIAAGSSFNGISDDFAVSRYLTDFAVSSSNTVVQSQYLKVYPNPIEGDEVTIQFSLTKNESVRISLLNLNGQVIGNFSFQDQSCGYDQQRLELPSNLESGIYFIRVQTEDGISIAKMVKE